MLSLPDIHKVPIQLLLFLLGLLIYTVFQKSSLGKLAVSTVGAPVTESTLELQLIEGPGPSCANFFPMETQVKFFF